MRFPYPGLKRASRTAVKLVLATSAVFAVHGQSVSYVTRGSVEVGPFLGASYGIVGAQYMVGGNLTVAVNNFFLPYVEYTYLPQVVRPTVVQSIPGATVSVDRNISFSDFHGGVHIRIPIREKPIVPYIAIGVGALTHSDQTVLATFHHSDGTTNTLPPLTQPGGSDFAFNAGGGLRYYINQRWGVRVEAKLYKPTGTFTSTFGKAEFGLFYQFR